MVAAKSAKWCASPQHPITLTPWKPFIGAAMSSEALLAISRNLAIMAVFAVVLQVWLVSVFGRSAARRQVALRLASHDELDALPEEQESALVSGRFERTLVRAGVQLTQAKVLLY